MKKIELLAPAGSFEALMAAVNYGADAVYLGGTTFSARAFANNFNHEELIEAVKYCHLRNVKVYVTLNTLLNEDEIQNALAEARFYYQNKVDALIIQDLGLFYLIRQEMPDFALHASTQMHIHNLSGVKNAQYLGFTKVVLARESNIDLIKEACKEDIEIECFVHGAICTSYSGQCLMSSVTKNRSANKGMCAQCCRLKYHLFDDDTNREIPTKTDYLLSPKDMYLLKDIPELIESGVSSLKIEGRLKSPSYVGLVTSLYRKAIDAYYQRENFNLTKEDYNNLLTVFNRGFTNAYLHDSPNDIYGNKRPNHLGIEVGKVINYNDGHCAIRLFKELKQFDGIRILNKHEDVGKILNTLSIKGKFVSSATKNVVIEINIDGKVEKGDLVVKTLDAQLEQKLNNFALKRIPLNLHLDFKEDKPISIIADLNNITFKKTYDVCPEKAQKAPISYETLKKQFSKFGDEPFVLNDFKVTLGMAFLTIGQINEVRRQFIEDLKETILDSFKRTNKPFLKLPELDITNDDHYLVENEVNEFEFNNEIKLDPVINVQAKYAHSEICTEFGNLLGNNKRIAYYTLNCQNSYAYEFLNRLGFNKIILSTELSNEQIAKLINSFYKRFAITIKPYVLVYGRRSLMYFRRNPLIDYIDDAHHYRLSDGQNNYLFNINDNYYELKESIPLINTGLSNESYQKFFIVSNQKDLKDIKRLFSIELK